MPRGKPWSLEEETKLKQLIALGQSLESIASQMGKTPNAIYQKCLKLGLVEEENSTATSSSITLPKELPSVEEALKILAGALKASSKASLDRVEVQRLQVVATLARTYKDLLADYIGYRQIETKLVELEAKYAELAKKAKNNAPKPNNAQMVQPTAK